jgi:hypothetical protein
LDSEKYKKYSEHFINFIIKGKTFDINAFKTRDEFDKFKKELDQYSKENERNK